MATAFGLSPHRWLDQPERPPHFGAQTGKLLRIRRGREWAVGPEGGCQQHPEIVVHAALFVARPQPSQISASHLVFCVTARTR